MTLDQNIHQALEKIGSLTITTLDQSRSGQETIHSRIISICGSDDQGSHIHQYFLEDAARYPAMRFFCIHRGKGEIYDYDFEMENRDHKLLRTRFAF